MRRFLRLLATLVQLPLVATGSALDPVWGSQSVVDLWGTETSSFDYAGRGTLALQEQRYPWVVYLIRSGGITSLRSVEWREGVRQDQPMFPVSYYSSTIRAAAHGDRVAVSWSEGSVGGTGYVTVRFSLRDGGVWSAPETVAQGYYPSSDLAFTPDGTPVMAVAMRGDSQNQSTVRWWARGQGAWTGSEVATLSRSVSSCHVAIDPAGVPTVAWRAYGAYSGSPPATVQYARREGQQWTLRDVPNASLIEVLLSGPAGEPCVITRRINESTAEFRSLAVEADPPVAITAQAGPVVCATGLPDGTICAIRGDSLIVRRDGAWSEAPCPWTHGLAAGTDGTLHSVGEKNGMIHYGTLLPGELPVLHPLTTYAEGSAILDDVAMHPDGSPRIFGWLGGNRKYSPSDGSWVSEAMSFQSYLPLRAYDRAGRLHAFSPASGHYAVEQPDGSMEVSSLPVSVTSSSSGSLYAFMLDDDDVLHAGFYTDLGTASVAVRYAVKRGTEWTVETVAAGEYSDQHCALALDPAGQPWMFTSRGLFRRTGTGWVREYETSNARFPGLGISSDGTVHAVFFGGVGWRSLTGKNGSYEVEGFDSYQLSSTVPDFAMAGDRPILVYGRQHNYSPMREAIVLAEKVGGVWRQRLLTPRGWGGRVGDKLQLVATADGHWTVGGLLREQQANYIRNVLFVCQGNLPRFESGAHAVVPSLATGGGRRFQIDMGTGPFLAPLELQVSGDLGSWTPVLDLGPAFRIRPGAEGLSLRGDPFRTHIAYEAPIGQPAWFVRFAGAAAGN